MITRIKRLISAPAFEGDEDKTRIARLLNVILWATLGVALVALSCLPLVENPSNGILAIGLMILLTLGGLLLMRSGHVRFAGGLYSLLIWAFDTGLIYISGGLGSPMLSSYVVAVLMAGLLLGGGAAVLVAVVSGAAGGVMAYAENNGMLPPSWMLDNPTGRLIGFLGNLVIAAALLYLAIRSINEALAQARSKERQLNESNQDLQAARASLEESNEQLRTAVERYVDHMASVARGDLSKRLLIDGNGRGGKDPLTTLAHQLNETTASLQGTIARIQDTATSLSSASAEILAASSQQASGASEQSAAVSQTTTTVDQVRAISEQSVQRAQEVLDVSQRTVDASRSGQTAVENAFETMAQIETRVESIAENILALSAQTQRIGEIIATVQDLAAQSNILALNASVEAARAGEQGKGFAVVAVEVRNLANLSRQATEQVRAILSSIQNGINTTVMATEEGTKVVDEGVRLVAQMQEVFNHLIGAINESAQSVTQMMAGGRQQATGVEQIAIAMQNINQATVQNLASTRQVESAARDLNELAGSLTETVEQYQI